MAADDPKKTIQELKDVLKAFLQSLTNITSGLSEAKQAFGAVDKMISDGIITTKEQLQDVSTVFTSEMMGDQKKLKKYFQDTLKMTEDVADQYLDIVKMSDDQIKSLKKIQDLEEKRYDKSIQINSEASNYSDFLYDQLKIIKLTNKSGADLTSQLQQRVKLQSKFKDVFKMDVDTSGELLDKMSSIREVMANVGSKTFELNGKVNLNGDQLISEIDKIKNSALTSIQEMSNDMDTKLEDLVMAEQGLRMTTSGQLQKKSTKTNLTGDARTKAEDDISKKVGVYKALLDIETDIAMVEDKRYKDLKDNQKVAILNARQAKTQLKVYHDMYSQNSENLKLVMKFRPALRAGKVAGDSFVDGLRQMSEVLPAGLKSFLQIEQSLDGLAANNTKAIKTFTSELASGKSTAQAMRTSFGGWSKGLKSSLGFGAGFAIVLAGIFKATEMLSAKYKEIGNEVGMSAKQAKQLYFNNMKVLESSHNQYSTMEDLLEVQSAYVEQTGLAGYMSTQAGAQIAESIDKVSAAYSVGASTTVGAVQTLMQLGSSMEDAVKLTAGMYKAAEKSGFDPEMIGKDLVDNAELVSTYYGGMKDKAIAATIATKSMGVSLKQVGGIVDKMLNIDGFMTDMYELNAMGGPDLSQAFELGLSGDLTGMMKEVMNATGGLEKFNQEAPLVKKKLAATLGMSVDELAKSLSLEKQMANLDPKHQEMLRNNYEILGDINGITQEEIDKRLNDIDNTKKLHVAMDKIKNVLIQAILPAVTGFSDMIDHMSPALNGIVNIFKLIGVGISGMAEIFGAILKPIGWFVSLFGDAHTETEKVSSSVKDITKNVGDTTTKVASLLDGTSGLGQVVKYLGGGFLAWNFGIKQSVSAIGSMGSGAAKLFTFIKKGISGESLMSQVVGDPSEVKEKTSWLKDTFGGIVDKIKGKVLGKSAEPATLTESVGESVTEKVTKSAKSSKDGGIVSSLTGGVSTFMAAAKKWAASFRGIVKELVGIGSDLVKQLGAMLNSAVKSLVGIGDKIVTFVSKTITSLGKGIGSAIDSILSGIGKGVSSLGKMISSLGKGIGSAVDSIFSGIGKAVASMGKGIGSAIDSILSGIGKGLNSFGPKALVGAAAMLVLASSVWVLSEAIQNMAGTSWEDMAKIGVAIVGLGIAGAALGLASELIIPGAIALGLLGIALIPLAAALNIATPAMGAFGDLIGKAFNGISEVVTSVGTSLVGIFTALSMADPIQLAGTAVALGLLSAALVAFGGGSALAGIGSAIGDFFGGDPIEKLQKFADIADPLNIAANAVRMLGESIGVLSKNLGEADLKDLAKLSTVSVGAAAYSGANAPPTAYQQPITASPAPPSARETGQHTSINHAPPIGTPVDNTSPQSFGSNSMGFGKSSTGGNNMAKTELILNQVLSAIVATNSRPLVIQFDDGTVKHLNNRSKALNNNR
jgi:hypothetical protein